jgi:uncharacterized membrane protein
MTPDNGFAPEPPLFQAILTPHRSLSGVGFLAVMLALGGISFASGILFLILGAWPVTGFLGLDVALVYWAFRANYRAASAYEEVTVTSSQLTLRKVSHRGKIAEWSLNPLWVKLDREVDEEFGTSRLFLVSRGRRLPVAGFLTPSEKDSFAAALGAAIGQAKRGPTRSSAGI